jgi:murein L,D-transpeptidase YcbB/YkuD
LPAGTRPNNESLVYTGALVSAVKRFQRRHGLDTDGCIGPQTLAQLNTPIRARVLQLQLTLERWRWLPARLDAPPIIVNIPEFVLRAMDENFHAALTMKIVVGMAAIRETPTFAASMNSVEFRPYWNVPLSIQRDEILPELERHPAYLARNDYEITNSRGDPVDANPRKKAVRDKLRSGELLIRQLPGPRNALGFVKFEFPNRYGIYLHGTPSQGLFARPQRAFSHGCIRAERPAELAAWVLRGVPGWDLEHVRAAMNGDASVRVELKETIPVLIVYGTAIVLQNGEVHFFHDVYGRDAALEQALRARHADHR